MQQKWFSNNENQRLHHRINSEFTPLIAYNTTKHTQQPPENTPKLEQTTIIKKKNTKKLHSCTVFNVAPHPPKTNQLNDSAVWQVPPKADPLNSDRGHSRRMSVLHQRKPSTTFQQLLRTRENSCDLPTQPSTMHKRDAPSLCCEERVDVVSLDQPWVYSNETIQYLMLREIELQSDPDYLKRHPALTYLMRAILMDWMMEVCTEFRLKRETFHLAVGLVDRFLSTTQGVQKVQLQLIGVCAMMISSKIEVQILKTGIDTQEIHPPTIQDFARSADYGYALEKILQMEIIFLTELRWETTFPTMNMWLNWYCGQWDLYVQQEARFSFKQATEESYQLYRHLCQLVDCAILDIDTLKFKFRQTLAAFMYLVLAIRFDHMGSKTIIELVPNNTQFLMDSSNGFNKLFQGFAQFNFGFNLPDLLQNIQFCAKFFTLRLSYEVPDSIHHNTFIQEGNYEEFLSFQTHNQSNLQCVKLKRN